MNTETEKKEKLSVEGLDVLLEKSREIDLKCSDYIVKEASTHNVRLNDFAGLSFVGHNVLFNETDVEQKNLSLTRYSMSQLGTKLGVPARYLEKCINTGRLDLAQENVNSWLLDYNKDLLIREYAGSIRGILSSKYSICDTTEVLETLDKNVDISHYRVKGSYLSPERFHLRLVDTEMLPIEGEDLFAGITIDSSDVGRSTLNINFLIYKQVCTNGLIISKSSSNMFRQKHIGVSSDLFLKGLEESLSLVPLLKDEVCTMIEQTKYEDAPYNFKGLDNEELADLIARIKATANVSEDNVKKVIEIMNTDRYEPNRWGYINALTDVAKDLTLEKRIELERYASTLLVA